jgi:hypothetical protein
MGWTVWRVIATVATLMETPNTGTDVAPQGRASATGLNVLALLCSLWFLLMGGIWAYGLPLLLAYPAAIVGLFLRSAAKKRDPSSKLNRVVHWVFILGLVVSLVSLILTK